MNMCMMSVCKSVYTCLHQEGEKTLLPVYIRIHLVRISCLFSLKSNPRKLLSFLSLYTSTSYSAKTLIFLSRVVTQLVPVTFFVISLRSRMKNLGTDTD